MTGSKSKIIIVEPNAAALKELEAKLAPYYLVVGIAQIDRLPAILRSERDVAAFIASTSKGFDVLAVLDAAKQQRPDVLRVLLTEFENLAVVVEGLHSGAVQRVVSRPIQYAELLGVIRSAPEQVSASKTA